jgi:hypothetical protein
MSNGDGKTLDLFKSLPISRVERRAIHTSTQMALDPIPEQIAFQHTVLCQTSLPYRNQGDGVRRWERKQGNVSLLIEAGSAINPVTDEWVELGLPFGPKPRLILAYLNAEALKQGSPVIEVEESLTAFVRRIQDPLKAGKSGPNGYEIGVFKDQLSRLSTATIRLAVTAGERAVQVNSHIVEAFDLWFAKDERQRVLWPSTIRLDDKYFASLQKHAIPLDERALAALSHSAMALDIYTWLAHRLHRIPPGKPQFISWVSLKEQFGQGYGRMNNFRARFLTALQQVICQYREVRLEESLRGITLFQSPPPVPSRRMLVVKGSVDN